MTVDKSTSHENAVRELTKLRTTIKTDPVLSNAVIDPLNELLIALKDGPWDEEAAFNFSMFMAGVNCGVALHAIEAIKVLNDAMKGGH